MTSSNGNIFRVTGHLCGEFTGPQWIPHTKASDAGLGCFLWSAPELLSKQWRGWWFETQSCSLWRHRNESSNSKRQPTCLLYGRPLGCLWQWRTEKCGRMLRKPDCTASSHYMNQWVLWQSSAGNLTGNAADIHLRYEFEITTFYFAKKACQSTFET